MLLEQRNEVSIMAVHSRPYPGAGQIKSFYKPSSKIKTLNIHYHIRPVYSLHPLVIRGIIRVLSRIRLLVVQKLQKPIEPCTQGRAQKRPDPVDPMILWELEASDGTAKASGRVEGSTRVVST